jgi:outer membrane receptor for ferrienterochelin and colicin
MRAYRRPAAGLLTLLVALILSVPGGVLFAQQTPTGRVVGKVVDAESGAPIVSAVVEIVGTSTLAHTGVDGRYTLVGVPVGEVAIRARMIGYQAKTVTGVVVPPGGAVGQDVSLIPVAFEIEEMTVAAAAERGTVARALEEQRTSTAIVSSVTAEEIQRTPDSDAGQAVQRVSGVTVQDGTFIFVRGLGERYTSTTLNGTRVPSPEPEKRIVPLDLFPSSLLEGITTSKTFTPDQSGDFSGARVELKTKEFPVQGLATLSLSAGFNGSGSFNNVVKAPRAGGEFIAVGSGDRAIPDAAAQAGDLTGLSTPEVNNVIASFRDIWSAYSNTGYKNGGLGLSIGGENPVFGQLLGYVASLSYSEDQELREDEERALATTGGPVNAYSGESGRLAVLWGGLLNLSTRLGSNTRLALENTYTRSADNEATVLHGVNEQFSQFGLLEITRMSYTERSVLSSQLRGDHLLGARHMLDWAASYAKTRRYEPDRSDLVYSSAQNADGSFRRIAWADVPQGASRTFSDLHEDSWQGKLNYRLYLGDPQKLRSVKVGVDYRTTDRDADSRQFDIRNLGLTDQELTGDPEVLFGDANAGAGKLTLLANANVGRYTASEDITAAYLQAEFPLSGRLSLVGGARVEKWDLTVNSIKTNGTTSVSNPNSTDVLPSLSLTYQLAPDHQLRLSGSQTVSRPEYREVSDVNSFDILGGLQMFGNPDLDRALIQNLDLRWEWYPRPGEAISIAGFAKWFDNPIEQIQVAQTGANALSWVNADAAENYGVELEVRKRLDFLGGALAPFSVFGNLTLMHSEIQTGNDSISALTNDKRPMVGQAKEVVNAGLNYASAGGFTATLLYNLTGRRIADAGVQPLPDTYVEARSLLDASVQFPVGGMLFRLDGKNLIDDPVERTQGDITTLRYRTGRIFRMGVTIGL